MSRTTFIQFSKFLLIGVSNTAVDFLVLNTLLIAFATNSSYIFAGYKAISFTVASLNSYIWNKYWAFKQVSAHGVNVREQRNFILVSIGGLCINTTVSFVVFAIIMHSYPTLSHIMSGNIAGLFGTAIGLGWNFIAYKWFVFKHTQTI